MEQTPNIDPQTGGLIFKQQKIDFQKLEREQEVLRQRIKNEIFDQFPLTGLYKDEPEQKWFSFIKQLMDYFALQEGPRGESLNKIQNKMKKLPNDFPNLLQQVLNLDIDKCNIKDIEIALKQYKRLPIEYKQYEKNKEMIQILQRDINDLYDEYSIKHKTILYGLYDKYGDLEICKQKMSNIIDAKDIQLLNYQNNQKILQEQLENTQSYINYQQLIQYINPLLQEWMEVDQKVGYDSNDKGNDLEEIMKKDSILDLMLFRIGYKKEEIDFYFNINWHNTPGEIDILGLRKLDSYPVVIAEIKARCFDIVYGYKQSGPERDSSKKFVKLFNKQKNMVETVEIPYNIDCFVLTCIPPNDFKLGFESKLKVELTKYTQSKLEKNQNLDYLYLYNQISPIFKNQISPQAFLEQFPEKILILRNL